MNLFKDQVAISERVHKKRKIPRKRDDKLFLCPSCRCVWEIQRKTNGTKRQLTYDHIPRYGKKKVICQRCI